MDVVIKKSMKEWFTESFNYLIYEWINKREIIIVMNECISESTDNLAKEQMNMNVREYEWIYE